MWWRSTGRYTGRHSRLCAFHAAANEVHRSANRTFLARWVGFHQGGREQRKGPQGPLNCCGGLRFETDGLEQHTKHLSPLILKLGATSKIRLVVMTSERMTLEWRGHRRFLMMGRAHARQIFFFNNHHSRRRDSRPKSTPKLYLNVLLLVEDRR
jgi:hypothetical protein